VEINVSFCIAGRLRVLAAPQPSCGTISFFILLLGGRMKRKILYLILANLLLVSSIISGMIGFFFMLYIGGWLALLFFFFGVWNFKNQKISAQQETPSEDQNRLFKLIVKILLIILACIQIVISLGLQIYWIQRFIGAPKESTYYLGEQVQQNEAKYAEDWAFWNYGQKIDGTKGEKGVDIGIDVFHPLSAISEDEIVVGVVDSGVYVSADMENRFLAGRDFYNDDETTFDEDIYDYHGTYTANIILKATSSSKILPVKCINGTDGSLEDIRAAVQYAVDNGAKIINCSWNFSEYDEALYQMIKGNPNILFVCAAGNSNVNLDKVKLYPCSYDAENIINVMAIDNRGVPYESSGYGAKAVHIAAPGKNVKVMLPNDEEALMDGTSVAAAFVTAASAALLEQNGALSPVEIKELLIRNALKLPTLEGKCLSGGIVQIKASALVASSATPTA
jgi:subtilisin family serine protease